MNREDDQELWDLMGRAAPPRLSAFFARNILRHLRQEPGPSGGMQRGLGLGMLLPVSGVALALVVAVLLWRNSLPNHTSSLAKSKPPATIAAPRAPAPVVKSDAPVEKSVRVEKIESPASDLVSLAKIDDQDYDVIANLDDLLVLYETSLWDENSSL